MERAHGEPSETRPRLPDRLVKMARGVVPTACGEDQQVRRRARRSNPQPRQSAARLAVQREPRIRNGELNPWPLETPEVAGHQPDPAADPHTQPLATTLVPASGEYLPQTTPPLIFAEEPRANLALHTVFQLYLRGYPREAIASKLEIQQKQIRKSLRKIRVAIQHYMAENPAVFGGPLEALYLQVLRRRERQSAIWDEIKQAESKTRPAFYRLLGDEDKAIEGLLGLDSRTLQVIVGTPIEQAQADLLRTLGPEGLKDLLADIRQTHHQLTGSSAIEIDGVAAPVTITDGRRVDDERARRRQKRRAGRTAGPR